MQKKPFNSVLLWRFHEYGVVHVMSDLDLIILENDIRITCPYLSYTTFIYSKLWFTGVCPCISFVFFHKSIDCGYSLGRF